MGSYMSIRAIYKTKHEVESRLSQFGVTNDEIKAIALQAASARASATDLHPINAPGLFSYLEGVAAMRELFLPKGWQISRTMGIEAVKSDFYKTAIIFQNVDLACGDFDPNPISRKGEGAKKLLDNPTGYLWNSMEEEELSKENEKIWFLCVSINNNKLNAELSRPKSLLGYQFGLFLERIFININEEPPFDKYLNKNNSPLDSNEIKDSDIVVTKK